jgi:hypothetical protein
LVLARLEDAAPSREITARCHFARSRLSFPGCPIPQPHIGRLSEGLVSSGS